MARKTKAAVRRDLTVTLRELAWTVHRRAPERAGYGPIPTTELALLKQVLDTPGATVGELSQALGLRQSNTSAALRTLSSRGFIVRESSASDRRVVRIMPTPLGATEHAAIADAWVSPMESALAELSDEHRDILEGSTEALRALDRALRAVPRTTDSVG